MINISMKTQISAKAADVWAVVGDFSALPKYVEAAVESTVEGDGVGSVRILTLPDGAKLRERLEYYDADKMTLKYSILDGPLPVENYVSTMVIKDSEGGCELEWSCEFDVKGTSDEEARSTMAGIYEMGFNGLAKLFK